MDPDALVDDMINIVSDLDGMPKGATRTRLLQELDYKRADLYAWKQKGGFAPKIGWAAALAL